MHAPAATLWYGSVMARQPESIIFWFHVLKGNSRLTWLNRGFVKVIRAYVSDVSDAEF